ncbi:MAG: hypothetical protein H7039_23725 [Bryobacteraceae bacterium]|nr:hypothetical protein [Bryobacteraceae bacterium]
MRSVFFLTIVACSLPSFAEVIDRVAVSMENRIITSSEVVRQVRITALLNGTEPDLGASSRREAAERLVDQTLIRREISTSNYVPDAAVHSKQMYAEFRKRFSSEEQYRGSLAKYRLTDADVREAFDWQATFLDFIEVRFRPGVTIPQDELQAFYNEQFSAASSPEAKMSFDEARPRIEVLLMQQRVDNALDRWLGQVRTQTRIRYRDEAFQ